MMEVILVEIMDPIIKKIIKYLIWNIITAVMVSSCDFIGLIINCDLILSSIFKGYHIS